MPIVNTKYPFFMEKVSRNDEQNYFQKAVLMIDKNT